MVTILPCGGKHPYTLKRAWRDQPKKVRDGYEDASGNTWPWHQQDGQKGHWDVQIGKGKNPKHTNVGEDGQVDHGPDNFPKSNVSRFFGWVRNGVQRVWHGLGHAVGGCTAQDTACTM